MQLKLVLKEAMAIIQSSAAGRKDAVLVLETNSSLSLSKAFITKLTKFCLNS